MILTYNNKLANLSGHLRDYGDPYNPCFLDPGIVRFAFYDSSYDPNTDWSHPQSSHGSFTYVGTETRNGTTYYIWDFDPKSYGMQEHFKELTKDFEVWGWHTSSDTPNVEYSFRNSKIKKIDTNLDLSVIDTTEMFANSSLVEVTGKIRMNATRMVGTFRTCADLVSVPVFDWAYIPANVNFMFQNCYVLGSGLYDFYQHCISATSHSETFGGNCARGSVSGTAELALIPDNWKYY